MKTTSIKLEKDGFNDLLPRKDIKIALGDLPPHKIVDLEKEYWQNEEDTLVFAMDKTTFTDGLLVGLVVKKINADEFNFMEIDDKIVIRLWWD
jgi:hypothetical protein